jgi:fibronectin-binding autotransporter adhesin
MKIQIGLAVLLSMAGARAASANTIHVCSTCAHATIQAAVNDAASGDTVTIAAGRYDENVTIEGKALILAGAAGGTSGVTEVHAAGRGPVFTLGTGATGATPELIEVHNLVVSGGNHTGGSGIGGGIQVRAGSYLKLYDSTVTQSVAVSGGGIGIDSPGAPQTLLSNCQIVANTATATYTGGGGGIAVQRGSSVTIQGSTIAHNTSHDGGGVFGDAGSQIVLTDAVVSSNTSTAFSTHVGPTGGSGGGLLTNGSLTISGSTIVDNVADGEGSGGGGLWVALNNGDTHVISNTIFAHNSLTTDEPEGLGGGIAAVGPVAQPHLVLTLSSDYIVQNTAAAGGGIWKSDVTLALNNTTVRDNIGTGQICDNDSGCD